MSPTEKAMKYKEYLEDGWNELASGAVQLLATQKMESIV
jgi:hypothetical protein